MEKKKQQWKQVICIQSYQNPETDVGIKQVLQGPTPGPQLQYQPYTQTQTQPLWHLPCGKQGT